MRNDTWTYPSTRLWRQLVQFSIHKKIPLHMGENMKATPQARRAQAIEHGERQYLCHSTVHSRNLRGTNRTRRRERPLDAHLLLTMRGGRVESRRARRGHPWRYNLCLAGLATEVPRLNRRRSPHFASRAQLGMRVRGTGQQRKKNWHGRSSPKRL